MECNQEITLKVTSFVPDTEDETPASFWITNPNNTWVGNIAVGSFYVGELTCVFISLYSVKLLN
jgi:hypothetical protein